MVHGEVNSNLEAVIYSVWCMGKSTVYLEAVIFSVWCMGKSTVILKEYYSVYGAEGSQQ